MNTRHFKAELAAYLSGGLTEAQRRQVDEHLAECEKCRQALARAKSKQSRFRREALKSATSDRMPNLFLNRLERQVPSGRRRFSYFWVGLGLVVIGVGVLFVRHDWQRFQFNPTGGVSVSSATVHADEPSVVPSVAPVVNTPAAAPAVSSPTTPSAVTAIEPGESQPLGQWKGGSSQIKEYREVVIRGRAAWRALWVEMGQGEAAPHINFYNYIVVGVFAGEKPTSGYEVTLQPARETADEIVIPVRVKAPGAEVGAVTTASYPYHLMVIQRSAKPIRFGRKSAAA